MKPVFRCSLDYILGDVIKDCFNADSLPIQPLKLTWRYKPLSKPKKRMPITEVSIEDTHRRAI